MKYVVILASMLLMVNCGATKAGKNPDPLQESERIILLDRAHKMWLKVVKSKIDRLPAGQMEVSLEVENRKNDDIWTDVQVIFRGADGFEIEKTSWTPFMFHRREVNTFKMGSMNPNAVDYRIIIRKPN